MKLRNSKIYPDEAKRLIAVLVFIAVILAMTAMVNFVANDSLVPEINAGDDTLGVTTEYKENQKGSQE
jgi:hypothetical protein